MSSQKQVQELAEQLHREASMQRVNTSQTIADLMDYVRDHQSSDFLCQPSHTRNSKANPYREKSMCTII